jgi:hypothetical protein
MLGRMISPDTVVPDALNSQSWNRYSYVGNDPLTFTDPTGHSWLSNFFGAIFGALRSLFNIPIIRAIATIALSIILTPAFAALGEFAGAAAAAVSSAAVTGLAGGKIGDILKAGLIAGATAFAFNAIGTATNAVAADAGSGAARIFNVATHAGVGCLSAVASGGKCGAGALSGGISAAADPFSPSDLVGGTVAHGIIGGLASLAGGGKFENGAITGAFGYLFNFRSHPFLRAAVPGQIAYDDGMTALEENRYGGAAFSFGLMLGEQVLTVLTLGIYRPGVALVETVAADYGAVAARPLTQAGREWTLGESKSAETWANQMQKRGWTPSQITDAISNGESFQAPNSVNPGNPATRFVSPQTGQSVVLDTVTREVLHIGGPGFRY